MTEKEKEEKRKRELERTRRKLEQDKQQLALQGEIPESKSFFSLRTKLVEKTLTPAEKKKREEVAKAMERENPGMPMAKKMAIATATAKRVAEESLLEAKRIISTHGTGVHTAKVYRDPEHNEFQVHYFKNGKHMGEGPVSYHDDKEDAQSTANSEVKRMNSKVSEEVEQIEELKRSTLASYTQKAADQMAHASIQKSTGAAKQVMGRLGDVPELKKQGEKQETQAFKTILKRSKGIAGASRRLAREGYENPTMEKIDMAKTQAHFIKYAAEEILEYLDMGGEIEEWYQNKLSKTHSDMEGLHSWVEGNKRKTGMTEEVHPDALHVKPVKVDGQTKYKVHAVGKNFSSGIKPGEHLSDSELDDFSEMGGKVKHVKEAVEDRIYDKGHSPERLQQTINKAREHEKSYFKKRADSFFKPTDYESRRKEDSRLQRVRKVMHAASAAKQYATGTAPKQFTGRIGRKY